MILIKQQLLEMEEFSTKAYEEIIFLKRDVAKKIIKPFFNKKKQEDTKKPEE